MTTTTDHPFTPLSAINQHVCAYEIRKLFMGAELCGKSPDQHVSGPAALSAIPLPTETTKER